MLLLPFTFFFVSCYTSVVDAGSANKGAACSQSDNRLQVGSNQFHSDCNSQTYCSSAGICEPKGCRRDDFPFGYAQDSSSIPPKCPTGQFCPDEEDACQPLLAVGSPCQLNRDDQCEGPSNWQELADTSSLALNVNGSVCLNNVCMWTNVTLGQACTVENVPYIAYQANNEYIDIVSRGNCKLGNYCDSTQRVCMATKDFAASCSADKECSSMNCMASGVCGRAAGSPDQLEIWIYAVVAVGIFGGMIATLVGLFLVHRRHRDVEREKRMLYWREQNALHRNILQMRDTARASILSLPLHGDQSVRSTLYNYGDESQVPIMQHAGRSGLRQQYVSEDGHSDYGESVVLHMEDDRRMANRF